MKIPTTRKPKPPSVPNDREDVQEMSQIFKKTLLITIVGPILLLLCAEVVLRYLGFDDPLLYVPDPQMGHRLAPNQNVTNFGNHIVINQYSMRGPEISKKRSRGEFRVLMLGDSVLNGVWWTDQAQTISARLQVALDPIGELREPAPNGSPRSVLVINASAQSWSPPSEVEYLKKFGSFDSNLLVLVINTEDLFSTQPKLFVVGNDPKYPEHKPLLAIEGAASRYLFPNLPNLPKLFHPSMPQNPPEITSNSVDLSHPCLEAISQMIQITQRQGIPMFVVLTPLKRELEEPQGQDDRQAIDRLKQFLQGKQIDLLDLLPIFQATPNSKNLYRDGIHLSPLGNQQVSDRIFQHIQGFSSRLRE